MEIDVKTNPECHYWTVFLNGEKVEYCFAASEEEGWADVYNIRIS